MAIKNSLWSSHNNESATAVHEWLPLLLVAVLCGAFGIIAAYTYHYGFHLPSRTTAIASETTDIQVPDNVRYAAANAETPSATVKAFDVIMTGNNILYGGPFNVKQGDRVIINIRSHNQGEGEFVIDGMGFHIATSVETNNRQQLSFIASEKGDFPIFFDQNEYWEGEVQHTQIGKLHVY